MFSIGDIILNAQLISKLIFHSVPTINMNLSVSKTHFASQISRPHQIAQNWFCIQNLGLDLSFQEKKAVCKSVTWFKSYNNSSDTREFRRFFLSAL